MPTDPYYNDPATRADGSVLEVASRYEEALSKSTSVDLAHFLPPPDDEMRLAVLQELVRIDLMCRWQNGERVFLEDYVSRFPELGGVNSLPARLIHAEYRARHTANGDCPDLSEYERRFPEQFPELSQYVEDSDQTALPNTSANETDQMPDEDAPEPPPGGWESNGYKLIKQIDRGGFGEIWLAEARGGIAAAIKIIPRPTDHADAQRELRSLELIKGLHHHFLMKVHAFWQMEDRLLIAMDLAEGNLRGRLRACRREGLTGIPIDELLNYFLESAEALDHLHDNQIQHRDIKPENILLVGGHVRVADFGLAYRHQLDRLVTSGLAGSLPYMSPESCRGKVGPQSDQYSLAITYMVLRLDRNPYGRPESLHDWLKAHSDKEPDLTGLTPGEEVVVRKALSKKPEDRYPNCLAFARALEETLRPRPMAPAPPPTRWPLVAAACLVTMVLLAIPVWRYLHPPRLELLEPQRTALHAGDEKKIKLFANRDGIRGSIPLTFEVPKQLEIDPPSSEIPDELDHAMITVRAVDRAPTGPALIVVHAGEAKALIDVDVLRFATLPARCTPDPKAGVVISNGRKYFTSVSYDFGGATRVDFRLIPQTKETDAPAFYIMTDKVWNGLFREFDAIQRGVSLLLAIPSNLAQGAAGAFLAPHKWEYGGEPERTPNDPKDDLEDDGDHDTKNALRANNPRDPVLRVTAIEAHTFARWMMGGLLPTRREWDAAAGANLPFQTRWKSLPKEEQRLVAVARFGIGPMSLDVETIDVGPFGCRHMFGNGKEWTNTMASPPGITLAQWIEAGVRREFDDVYLRGQSYLIEAPKVCDGSERPWRRSPEIGFRVVLHP